MAPPISFIEARSRVIERSRVLLEPENVSLEQALGRRLATEVRADTPWPTTDRSAMDGFAVLVGADSAAFDAPLEVVGESLAGHPWSGRVEPGRAVRIMTGAVVPAGADAVVPVEDTSGFDGRTLTVTGTVQRGAHIRRAGSEVAEGQVLLEPGRCLRAAEVGALAVLGIDPVPVYRAPVVAILSTGDEVVPIDRVPEEHQVRDSNSHALAALVRELGGVPLRLGIARDDAGDLRSRLVQGLEEADVLLTIGGVSKGTHDLVHGTLAELGVREVFHGVALKPGKPTYFGEMDGRRGRFVFGLPGNPASCFTVFDLLVRPLLVRMSGAEEGPGEEFEVAVGGEPFRSNRRLQAVPAALRVDDGGRMVADLRRLRPSGDPFSLLDADGYALVPPETEPGALPRTPFVLYGAGWSR